jgi:O-antigen/teichoic acid export membrane protein
MADAERSDRRSIMDMAVSGGGSLFSPLINFITIPIVARLYGPAAFGEWALLMSVALIVGQVSTLRYELAVVLADDDADAGRLVGLSLLNILMISLVSLLAAGLIAARFETQAWASALLRYLPMFGLLVVALGIKVLADGWSVRLRAFRMRAASLGLMAGVTGGAQIGLYYLGQQSAAGMILGSLCGFAGAGLFLIIYLAVISPGTRPRFTELKRIARAHSKFPVFSAPYTILGNMRREGQKVILGAWGSASMVGAVALSWRLTNMPAQMISSGIRPVLFERAARTENLKDLQPFLQRILLVLGLVTLPALVFFEFHAETIFRLIFGSQWDAAIPYTRILAIPAILFLQTNWLDRVFDVTGRQDLVLRLETIFSVLSLSGLAVGLWVFGSSQLAIVIFSSILVVYYLSIAFTAFRLAGFDLRVIAIRQTSVLILALVLAGAYFGLRFLVFAPAAFVIQLVLSGLLALVLFRRFERRGTEQ